MSSDGRAEFLGKNMKHLGFEIGYLSKGEIMSQAEQSTDLIEELVSIREGSCLWCKLGKVHPFYSQCSCKTNAAPDRTARSMGFPAWQPPVLVPVQVNR